MDNIEQADAGFNDPDAVNCAVSGVILGAIGAGVPQSLTIPCRPWNKPDARGENAGKAPAVPAPEFPDGNGPWVGLEGWETCETPRARVDQADAASANCGLVLNVPGESPAGRFNFLAIDIDLDKGHPEYAGHRNTIMLEMSKHLGGSRMMWRETLPQRALLLVSVKDMAPGRKHVWKIKHGGAELGESKIELLAHGQQCVIAGRHHTGRDIFWRVADRPGKRWSAPPLYDVKPVEFDDFDSVVVMLESAFAALQGEGYEFPLDSAGGSGAGTADEKTLAPEWLRVRHLVDAFGRMDNPATCNREMYVSIAEATAGALRGIEAHHGTQPDRDKLGEAFAAWACSHKGPACGTYEGELAKWNSDWNKPDRDHRTGFDRLVSVADPLGAELLGLIYTAAPEGEGAKGSSASPDFDSLGDEPVRKLNIIRVSELEGKEPEPLEWIIPDWLPIGFVTLNYGDGGVGKTLLSQQLMTSCSAGAQFLGMKVMQCPTFGIFCEDPENVLHLRQKQINASLGIGFNRLSSMEWLSLYGEECALGGISGAHVASALVFRTPLFRTLEAHIAEIGARLVVIDTAATTFEGNENDRRQVSRYMGILTQMAKRQRCAVLLNAHPSREGLRTGNLDGASTAWNNSARSRWSLGRVDGDTTGTQRELMRRKANYAAKDDRIGLFWRNGVLLPDGAHAFQGELPGDRLKRPSAKDVFLELLDRCTATGVKLSASPNAANAAPKVMAGRSDSRGYDKQAFRKAMEELFTECTIDVAQYGRKGDERFHIVRTQRSPEAE